jgi:hypothetical protein
MAFLEEPNDKFYVRPSQFWKLSQMPVSYHLLVLTAWTAFQSTLIFCEISVFVKHPWPLFLKYKNITKNYHHKISEETTPETSRRPIQNIPKTTKQCPVKILYNIYLVPCILFVTRISEPYIEVLPLCYRLFIPQLRSPSTVDTTRAKQKEPKELQWSHCTTKCSHKTAGRECMKVTTSGNYQGKTAETDFKLPWASSETP